MADEYTERLVKLIVQANDPMRGVPTPPPPASAAQLRLAAQQRADTAAAIRFARRNTARWAVLRRHCLRWLIPLGVTIIVSVLAVVFGPVLHRPEDKQPSPSETGAAPAPLTLEFPDQAPAAREALQQLADRVAALPDPAPSGQYGHIHTQHWPATDSTPSAGQIVAVDEQVWTAPDHTAHQRVAVLPPQPAGRVLASWVDGPPATATPAQTRDYPAGQLSALADSPATEPAVLAGQLSAYQPAAHTPSSTLHAIAELNRYHVLGARQRAAALQVLADTDGLNYRGQVTDRAGRHGIAITVDTDRTTRDLAIFDADNGALLSYERTALNASTHQPHGPATVVSYLLYLSSEWTN